MASSPSGNTMSIWWMECPKSFALESMRPPDGTAGMLHQATDRHGLAGAAAAPRRRSEPLAPVPAFLVFRRGLTVLHAAVLVGVAPRAAREFDHLRAREQHGPVTMRREHAHRAIQVEHRIPAHARADAGAFHLALLIDTTRNAIPAERGRRAEGARIQPAPVDAARERVDEHRARGGFFIGLATIEQLVPQPRVPLMGDEPGGVSLE